MKKILYLLSFFIVLSASALAQDDEGGKIPDRMREYLQKRLNLSKSEADRFGPVFLNYYNDLKKTNQEFQGDRLMKQQKMVDLKLRYREQFKNIMGEKRSNDVFQYEHDFVDEAKRLQLERQQNRNEGRPGKRIKGQLR
jgi:hypothetical protein